ncbi:molybdopterin dinucleotide binding domain-containing protein [Streptomyces spiralis]|uniref:molybdopterin dinucleotide binding domain-containing protein n=1 Tax=Streptomyces spiralis TaxID=66376 RepID=UPI0035E9CACC
MGPPEPHPPFADGFPTPSGKLEFRSASAAAEGHDPLPGSHRSQAPEEDGRYPLVLLSTASHFRLNSVFGNKPELRRRAGGPEVSLHPADAAACGVSEGDAVVISSPRGSFGAVARLDGRATRGTALTEKGHWPRLSPGGEGVNATVAEDDADFGGGAVFHDNRVRVEPAGTAVT